MNSTEITDSALFTYGHDGLYQALRRATDIIAACCAASSNHGAIRSGKATIAHPPHFTRTR